MLPLNPQIVCDLITKAKVFHGKENVVLPDMPDSATGDLAQQALADYEGDETYQEICLTINDLEPDQQTALVALMWLGRGDFEAGEFDSALSQARQEWTPHTAEYLLARPLVAEYWQEGLALLDYNCE